MEVPRRLAWIKSGRFLRSISALTALAILIGVLYNAIMVDRLPPTFTIHATTVNSAGLALTLTSVEVDFSEDVRQDTAQSAFSIAPDVAGSFHWQGRRKLIFTPSAKLPLDATFKVVVAAGVEDLSGNAGSASDFTFTTVGAPNVDSVVPAPNADGVTVDSTIQITFDRPMDTEKVLAGLSIEPALGFEASWNGQVLTITPDIPLAYGTTYTIKIGDPAVDTDGTHLGAYVTSFRTVGIGLLVTSLIPAPSVAGVSPRSQIAVVFDGQIDPTTVAGAITLTPPVPGSTNLLSLPDDRNPPSAPTATPGGNASNVLVFTPSGPLADHTTYSVAMSSQVKRADGQAASPQSWSFTTGEAPTSALNQIAFLSDRDGVSNVWLMNPDGSNQREVTTELVPVSGFDISGDGTLIAYATGGVVKKMGIGGDAVQTLTPGGDLEYGPQFTPDGLGIVVGRRDGTGADLGYWLYPLATGSDIRTVAPDGAPGIGSVSLSGEGLTGQPGLPSWAARMAFTADSATALIVRGSDGVLEIVDMSGVNLPQKLDLISDSRPVYDSSENCFFVAATADNGESWWNWRITTTGEVTKMSPALSDVTTSGGSNADSLAFIGRSSDGTAQLMYLTVPSGTPEPLTNDPRYWDTSPSFSPDGSLIVFGRVTSQNTRASAGIWVVRIDGTALTNLATDGAYPRWIP